MKLVFISMVTTPMPLLCPSPPRPELRAACAMATVEQGHGHAAVGHAPRVAQLLAQVERDLGFTVFELEQIEAEHLDEGDEGVKR